MGNWLLTELSIVNCPLSINESKYLINKENKIMAVTMADITKLRK